MFPVIASMSFQKLQCAECGSVLKLKEEPRPGSRMRCPNCSATFRWRGSRARAAVTVPDDEHYWEDDEDDWDDRPPQRTRQRKRSKSRKSHRPLIIGLSVGGVILVLFTVLVLVIRLRGVGDPGSAFSLNDGSPMTIHNPRYYRAENGTMVLHADVEFSRAPDTFRNGEMSINIFGSQSGIGDTSYYLMSNQVEVRYEGSRGTLRAPIQSSRSGREVDVTIHITGRSEERLSNYMPATIPMTHAELPRE